MQSLFKKIRSSRTTRIVGCGLALLLAGVSLASYSYKGTKSFGKNADNKSSLVQASQPSQAKINESVGKLPLAFEPNQGQVDPRVKFLARAKGYTALLTENETVLAVKGSQAGVLRMKMQNAQPATSMVASEQQSSRSNYLSKRITNVPNYGKVTYKGIYPGIDVAYRGNQRSLEYDFVVNPGADPNQIRVAYEGTSTFALDAQGNLALETAAGKMVSHKPVVYQTVRGTRQPVQGDYVLLAGNQAGFRVGAYDHSRALVIDPVVTVYATLGGSGNDEANGIAVNTTGVYLTGRTTSVDYLVQSALQSTHSLLPAGNFDAFVTKLDATGTTLVYSTYLGTAGDDNAEGIVVDLSGNAYIAGYTNLALAAAPAPMVTFTGVYAAFVAKIAPNGQSLLAQTYLNSAGVTQAFSIAMSPANGNLVIGGLTNGIPGKTLAVGTGLNTSDGFIARFDTSLNIGANTLLGGTQYDQVNSVAVDANDNVYAVGQTASGNVAAAGGNVPFPISSATTSSTNAGPFVAAGTVPIGTQVAFVTKLNPALSSRVYSTIFGAGGEAANGVAVDPTGQAYVVGTTHSIAFSPGAQPVGSACQIAGVNPAAVPGSLPAGLLVTGIAGSAPLPGVVAAGPTCIEVAGSRRTQGFLLALNTATPGSAISTDGTPKYLDLQPASTTTVTAVGTLATCALTVSRFGSATGTVPNPCTGAVFNSWNGVAADSDQQAYVVGQLDNGGAYLKTDVMRFGKTGIGANGPVATPGVNPTNTEVIFDATVASTGYGIAVSGFRQAFIDGITTAPPALAAGQITQVGSVGLTTALQIGIIGLAPVMVPPTTTPLGPAIIGTVIPGGYAPAYPKTGGATLTTIGPNGLEDDFYAGIQYKDIFATPTVVNLGNVSVGSATGNAGPSATVSLFDRFGIATPCNVAPTVVATPAGSVTVTQIGSTNTYLVQLAPPAVATPGFINATATFTCGGAENATTVAISATVSGPLNLAPTATLSGTTVFNTGVLSPWNTLGLVDLAGNALIPVSVTTPIGFLPYGPITITTKSTNYPIATGVCAAGLFQANAGTGLVLLPVGTANYDGAAGIAGTPSAAPSTFTAFISSACAATLNPGTYTANFSVASTSASNPTQTLGVSLTVTAGTILTQAVAPLTFGASQNAQQTAFTINANNGTINYGINYISGGIFSPNGFALPGGNVQILTGISGTILGGGSQSVVVQVTPVGLAKGVYSGTFQVVQVNPATAALTNIQNLVLTVYVGTGLGVIRPAGANGVVISVPTGFLAAQLAQPFATGSATGPTTLALINAVPPTIAITGLDNTLNTPYTITAPVIAWTGTAPPANPVTGAASEVTIVPVGTCSTYAPSPQLSIVGVPCAYNINVDTVGITTPTTFTGTVTFSATATGGGSVVVPITLNVTGAPTLLSTNCPTEIRVGGITSGLPCVAPSATTPASPVIFNALTGTVNPGGNSNCFFVDVYATGGVIPGVTATIPATAPWASFSDLATIQTTALGNLTPTGVLINPFGLALGGTGFGICVNQLLAPQGAGTVSTLVTIQGSGVGTITIPVTFITSPNSPGMANFKQIGIFRNSIAGVGAGFVLDSSGTNNYVASDKARLFGQPGDTPVAGDFFGTGVIEIGVFRCPTGATVCQWFIDANNSGTWDGPFGGDQIWNFGIPGDIPVVGDWNGNGTSKIGIFRCPAVGSTTPCTWVLDAGNKHVYDGATAVIAYYGLAGDMPVVNNWNATGTVDQIGVFRGNGTWIVDSNGSNTWEASDAQYTYGLTGDMPVVGNWNGTGRKRIGVFRPSAGIWVLNLSGTNAWLPIDAVGNFGTVGDQPIVGLWTLP